MARYSATSCETVQLANGIRVVSECVPYVDSVSVGMWVCVGSRHERGETRGVSHFIEHMLFKGTETRSARQIADEIDSVGGHLNAFTDKETTWYYAKVLAEHLPVAMEVMADMALHSVLDSAEMEREKNVVLEEIKRHQDTPDDLVHDMLAESLWKGHPLGSPVIGTRKAVGAFSRDLVAGHIREHYTPGNIVIAAAGNLDHKALRKLAERHFGVMQGRGNSRHGRAVQALGARRFVARPVEQVHFCIGTAGYSQLDDNRYALAVLDAILGGGMSSRLFQEIRENRGLAYAIGSYVASYREGGLFAVYGGTSEENFSEVVDLVAKELHDIKSRKVEDKELLRAKNQIRGALVMGQESMSNRMSRLANSMLYFDRLIPVAEVIQAVMNVTADDLLRVANEVLVEDRTAFVAVGPSRWKKAVA